MKTHIVNYGTCFPPIITLWYIAISDALSFFLSLLICLSILCACVFVVNIRSSYGDNSIVWYINITTCWSSLLECLYIQDLRHILFLNFLIYFGVLYIFISEKKGYHNLRLYFKCTCENCKLLYLTMLDQNEKLRLHDLTKTPENSVIMEGKDPEPTGSSKVRKDNHNKERNSHKKFPKGIYYENENEISKETVQISFLLGCETTNQNIEIYSLSPSSEKYGYFGLGVIWGMCFDRPCV